MIPVIPDISIDDLFLQKFTASNKIRQVMSFVKEQCSGKMTRYACSGSSDKQELLKLFGQMLECLNLKADKDISSVLEAVSKQDKIDKVAEKSVDAGRNDVIKIVSKRVRDSHYQIDVSKDTIVNNGSKIFMVSCYARDAYLGRYLIKRNYYFTQDREASANAAYDEIMAKMNALKDRYYQDIISVPDVSYQMKVILDGVISEIKSEEDTLATNIKR